MTGEQVGDSRPAELRDQNIRRHQSGLGEASRQGTRRAAECTCNVVDVGGDGRVLEHVFDDRNCEWVERLSEDIQESRAGRVAGMLGDAVTQNSLNIRPAFKYDRVKAGLGSEYHFVTRHRTE